MAGTIYDENDFIKSTYVEAYYNAIPYYKSIENDLKGAVATLSDITVNGTVSEIDDAYLPFSKMIDNIRNYKVYDREHTYGTAESFFVKFWKSKAVSSIAREGSDLFTDIVVHRTKFRDTFRAFRSDIPSDKREKLIEYVEIIQSDIDSLFDVVDRIESGARSEVSEIEKQLESQGE